MAGGWDRGAKIVEVRAIYESVEFIWFLWDSGSEGVRRWDKTDSCRPLSWTRGVNLSSEGLESSNFATPIQRVWNGWMIGKRVLGRARVEGSVMGVFISIDQRIQNSRESAIWSFLSFIVQHIEIEEEVKRREHNQPFSIVTFASHSQSNLNLPPFPLSSSHTSRWPSNSHPSNPESETRYNYTHWEIFVFKFLSHDARSDRDV